MIQFPMIPSVRVFQLLRPASRLAGLGAALALFSASAASAAPPAYPQAVANSEAAARAVLARAGRESCLRGKLTRALLELSNSCEASGTRNSLCTLADKAVVVTPMSLTFMDDTSHQLLDLIRPVGSTTQASAGRVAPETEMPGEP
jgi:hypothetical protein